MTPPVQLSLRPLLIAAPLMLGAATPGFAQLLDTKVVSLDAARTVAAAAEAHARGNGWQIAIAVVDPGGGLVAFHRMDGVQHGSLDVSIGKARTAARFRRPTKALAEALAGGRMGFLGVEGVVQLERGVPLVVNGAVVGAIGVSGMTGEQDAAAAAAGVAALKP